jgi:hypothetical protein
MNGTRAFRLVVLAAWLAANGCTTLREVPRQDYGARSERRAVRVETREGLRYEFDYATFDGDSLTGYRSRTDVEGPVEQVSQFRLGFDEVQRVSTRELDWRRTGVIGGTVVAGVLAVALHSVLHHDNNPTSDSPGGKGFNP